MSRFSLPTKRPFEAASKTGVTPLQIIERKGEREITVATLLPLKDITAEEMNHLAANIKDFLNAMPLLYRFGAENRVMHYRPLTKEEDGETVALPLSEGIIFQFQHRQAGDIASKGNCMDVARLNIDADYKAFFERRIEATPGDFSGLFRAGTEPERRASARTHDSKPHTPKNTPAVS